jgi:hypothetical protein
MMVQTFWSDVVTSSPGRHDHLLHLDVEIVALPHRARLRACLIAAFLPPLSLLGCLC